MAHRCGSQSLSAGGAWLRFRRVLIELAQYAMELHSDSYHCAAELSMLKEELEGVTDRVHEVQAVTPSGKGATLA